MPQKEFHGRFHLNRAVGMMTAAGLAFEIMGNLGPLIQIFEIRAVFLKGHGGILITQTRAMGIRNFSKTER